MLLTAEQRFNPRRSFVLLQSVSYAFPRIQRILGPAPEEGFSERRLLFSSLPPGGRRNVTSN